MKFVEVTGKTVNEAITDALIQLESTSDKLEYEILEKGSTGFLGIGSKLAKIKAWRKLSREEIVYEFLEDILSKMKVRADIKMKYNESDRNIDIELVGTEMGVLIGKRGQTLDALQYLVSLVANKDREDYVRVRLDTENYRERRKETLENLARNIAFKVKRTKRSMALDPMNPFERRVIHSTLQNDKFVCTKSEGEDPFRHVVVMLKRER